MGGNKSPLFSQKRKKITEGFKGEGTPDMKYYAFDWDDNIVHMPTKIIVKSEDGEEIGMSTDDFAEHRHHLGKEPFNYKGETIVGYGDKPFRNFKTEGDKDFIIDAMRAKEGPAFNDFREAINNGSIFSIITARGHNPNTLKQAVYNYIINDYNGISKDELIKTYLDLNKYHPVSFGDETGAVNPEEAKVEAMEEFVTYIRGLASTLNKKAFLKNDINNNFIPSEPSIGFSDDDPKNIEVMKTHFKDKPDNIVRTYSTA